MNVASPLFGKYQTPSRFTATLSRERKNARKLKAERPPNTTTEQIAIVTELRSDGWRIARIGPITAASPKRLPHPNIIHDNPAGKVKIAASAGRLLIRSRTASSTLVMRHLLPPMVKGVLGGH